MKLRILLSLLILLVSLVFPISSVSAAKASCSKSELVKYNKAREQVVNDNTIIKLSKDIKIIIENARQAKSDLLGRFVDYSAKDLYDLQRQDDAISKAESHRDDWWPELKRLAKKCGKKMTTKNEYRSDYSGL